ncbi:hypothetical protein FVEG_16887 [Fusarium verticillioides 7600]|uniref:Uncharacterized protein n=1 Tax=Gibberella moniliformis (strain M3125 / FGSC 7600) TaxID=334819 RepID=W7N5N0_GIBM7|nr:hypothetical protein FVEG_16887 [Fusarium verticillioides 7600]EWG51932.1 hypothetical protein FVEG_16887 [Fusarium verticillioides 7600]
MEGERDYRTAQGGCKGHKACAPDARLKPAPLKLKAIAHGLQL